MCFRKYGSWWSLIWNSHEYFNRTLMKSFEWECDVERMFDHQPLFPEDLNTWIQLYWDLYFGNMMWRQCSMWKYCLWLTLMLQQNSGEVDWFALWLVMHTEILKLLSRAPLFSNDTLVSMVDLSWDFYGMLNHETLSSAEINTSRKRFSEWFMRIAALYGLFGGETW